MCVCVCVCVCVYVCVCVCAVYCVCVCVYVCVICHTQCLLNYTHAKRLSQGYIYIREGVVYQRTKETVSETSVGQPFGTHCTATSINMSSLPTISVETFSSPVFAPKERLRRLDNKHTHGHSSGAGHDDMNPPAQTCRVNTGRCTSTQDFPLLCIPTDY